MKPSFTVAAAVLSALAAVPALADAPTLPKGGGEVVTPSALAEGEQYLSISKPLKCVANTCSATVKGRAKKQTLITYISCLTFANDAAASFGVATDTEGSEVTLAIFPVLSRAISETVESAVVAGPTQIVLGPDDSFFFGVQANGPLLQGVCTLTGTTTRL
jgi:hypothetical protein